VGWSEQGQQQQQSSVAADAAGGGFAVAQDQGREEIGSEHVPSKGLGR